MDTERHKLKNPRSSVKSGECQKGIHTVDLVSSEILTKDSLIL